jgi:hypothetical protein
VTRRGAALAVAAALAGGAGAAQAGALRFCDRAVDLTPAEEDRVFRFGAIVKAELEQSGERVAIVARSGLNLDRFDIRYSHSGIILKDSPNGPWSVRQLYYACDEGRPRLFDQGVSGFLLGTDDVRTGYLSVVYLPPAQAAEAEAAGRDNARANTLLAGTYSANSYPFSTRYQNCNEWLVELLASAWATGNWPVPVAPTSTSSSTLGSPGDEPVVAADTGPTPPDASDPEPAPDDPRAQAQHWLRTHGYQPSVIDVGAYMPLAWFVPYVHSGDHPDDELKRRQYSVSMPASIEGFVRASLPGASRVEFCHAGNRVVVHHGWDAIGDGCVPGAGDQVLSLD